MVPRDVDEARTFVTNTHIFDGALDQRKKDLGEILLASRKTTYFEREASINYVAQQLSQIHLDERAKRVWDILMMCFKRCKPGESERSVPVHSQRKLYLPTNPNYDATNDLCVSELLHLLALQHQISIEQGDGDNAVTIIENLTIQLRDMQSGACPAGRTTRLFQLVPAMITDQKKLIVKMQEIVKE